MDVPFFPEFMGNALLAVITIVKVIQEYHETMDIELPPLAVDLINSSLSLILYTYTALEAHLPGMLRPSILQARDIIQRQSNQETTLWYMTGETVDSMRELIEEIRPHLEARSHRGGRPQVFSVENTVYLFLIWLRTYPTLQTMSDSFGVAIPTLQKLLEKALTAFYLALVPRYVRWHTPEQWQQLRGSFPEFPSVALIVDASPIRTNRPLGRLQGYYYRGDKHFHFMNWLVAVDVEGYFVFGKAGYRGHLVDAAVYDYAGMPPLPAGIQALADKGFANLPELLVPPRRGGPAVAAS